MEHLIDKSALVAEIENRIKKLQNLYKENEGKLNSIQKIAILLCIEECKVILSFINTLEVKYLQEEPVSIWHDASEEPNDKSSCLIHYIVGGKVSYRDIFPVIYNKEVREFVSESYPHPTGYKVKQSSLEGGVVAEVYKNMRDRFPLSDIYKWAYVDDILNLSNVERTGKNRKEEPKPKKCMFTLEEFTEEDRKVLCEDCDDDCEYAKKYISEDYANELIDKWYKYASWRNSKHEGVLNAYGDFIERDDIVEMVTHIIKWYNEYGKENS